ncbi:uncharacterized protein LOC120268549 [Dioscorea cayenensis subsp. rotundata]|uniref:Uncharacterized protein LOC120268549 n=1 Tax=Dioscorea cayennensis subsp. rotundata TaxID=55577 RepID=A0AB40BXI9_DIOCR|nr:uncharacterized protein LOC120268549 [Dioscorea cayenensis subsp. rotundata]
MKKLGQGQKKKCTEAANQGEKKSSTAERGKKKKASQCPEVGDEDKFLNKASKKKFKSIAGRGIVVESVIDEAAFENYGLMELLKERGLKKSATFAESYSLSLVQEVYSNLSSSDKGISKVFMQGKLIPFSPMSLNRFLEFKYEIKGNYDEGLELNEDVLKEITGGRTKSWGVESRLPASILIAKYNVFFGLGILNWLPTPHNSSIVKELTLLLFAIVTRKKFNMGRLIFQNVVKEADCTSFSILLSYPPLLPQYLLQHWIHLMK